MFAINIGSLFTLPRCLWPAREKWNKMFSYSCNIYFHLANSAGMVTGCSLSWYELLLFAITSSTTPMTRIKADTAMRTGISIPIKLSVASKLDLISSPNSSGRAMLCKLKNTCNVIKLYCTYILKITRIANHFILVSNVLNITYCVYKIYNNLPKEIRHLITLTNIKETLRFII